MSRSVMITDVRESDTFGEWFDMSPLRRQDGTYPEAIIVAVNNGYGFQLKKIILPHQLYLKDIEKLTEGRPETEVWVYPVFDSSDWARVIAPKETRNDHE